MKNFRGLMIITKRLCPNTAMVSEFNLESGQRFGTDPAWDFGQHLDQTSSKIKLCVGV